MCSFTSHVSSADSPNLGVLDSDRYTFTPVDGAVAIVVFSEADGGVSDVVSVWLDRVVSDIVHAGLGITIIAIIIRTPMAR